MKQQGSVLVVVLVVMVTVLIGITQCWRTTFHALDIVHKRIESEIYFRAMQGVMQYVITVCEQQYTRLLQSSRLVWNINAIEWPHDNYQLHATVVISKVNSSFDIMVTLFDRQEQVRTMRCCLEQLDNASFVINTMACDDF